jgi:hypothetical protein
VKLKEDEIKRIEEEKKGPFNMTYDFNWLNHLRMNLWIL